MQIFQECCFCRLYEKFTCLYVHIHLKRRRIQRQHLPAASARYHFPRETLETLDDVGVGNVELLI